MEQELEEMNVRDGGMNRFCFPLAEGNGERSARGWQEVERNADGGFGGFLGGVGGLGQDGGFNELRSVNFEFRISNFEFLGEALPND